MSSENPTILCLSHLAWEPTLFQRPQQLMSELSSLGWNVRYFGCVGARRAAALRGIQMRQQPNLQAINIAYAPGIKRAAMLRRLIARRQVKKAAGSACPLVVWLYHPSLLTLAAGMNRDLLVYDVMDQFDAFEKSREQVRADEQDVLANADVIFTGGVSLQASVSRKLEQQPGVAAATCHPSGVELDHFAQARHAATLVPDELAQLPKPVFGYYGAIDERIDFELLRKLAHAMPNASIALIGPQLIAEVPPMPQNVHLLGGRPYTALPAYLKGFDVCLLPFLTSRLVAHISPTKTPEYLAGGKPVVSTAIPDVQRHYGDIVSMCETHEQFVAAAGELACSPPAPDHLASEAARRTSTWVQIAKQMDTQLRTVLSL